MGPKRQGQKDGSKYTGPNRQDQLDGPQQTE